MYPIFPVWQRGYFDSEMLATGMRKSPKMKGKKSSGTHQRECLHCGMLHSLRLPEIQDRAAQELCIKCDNELFNQTDGSTLTIDIAHHRETVAEATQKFQNALNKAWQDTYAAQVRLIVGGGQIRDAILAELFFLKSKGTVLEFSEENRGAVLVKIR